MKTNKKLTEFVGEVGCYQASILLNKPEQTLRTRMRSKESDRWVVVNVGKNKKRCAKIDD